MPISPVYITALIALAIFIAGRVYKYKFEIHKLSMPAILYILYLLISQPLKNANTSSLINILFSLTYLIILLTLLKNIEKKDIVKYSTYFIKFTILLLTIEAVWRIAHPVFSFNGFNENFSTPEDLIFYAYKYSSIMFLDSNFVGTYALTAYFLYLYLFREKLVQSKLPLIIFAILIILTLSRSAIITVPITYILINITKKNGSYRNRIFFLIVLIIGGIYLYGKLLTDLSFQSKFKIIDLAVLYLRNVSFIDFLTGIGYGNTANFLGIGAHNLFITHIIESGLIGFIFFLICSFIFIKGSERKSLYVTFPLFISGMSLAGHALSYYFACLAIIYTINNKDGKNFCNNTNL